MAGGAQTGLGSLRSRVQGRLLDDDSGTLPTRIAALVAAEAPLLGDVARAGVVREVLAEVQGLGALEPLLADPEVSEIMVNGPGRVWVERSGVLERVNISLETGAIEHLVEKIVAPLGLRIDRSSPMVDARLPDGSRVNAIVPPLALDGPCVTIRRFGSRAVPLERFAPSSVVQLLTWAVACRYNLVVSGGTGAGKTTLLNALAGCIGTDERVITVEDAAELQLPGDHVVRLEARPANAEGAGGTSVRELVRNALRMRPDRIVVGEVRGPEALDMLQAMNSGHEGSLSTCHANGPDDALRRLETMVMMDEVRLPLPAVRAQLHSALDLIIQVGRYQGGQRRIVAVAEVAETEAAQDSSGGRTRLLAGPGGVIALPNRPPRVADAAPPRREWIGE